MTTFDTVRPPARFQRVRTWALTTTDDLSPLRSGLHRALGSCPGSDGAQAQLAETLALVASELATNALRHGLPPTAVHLLTDGDDFVLDVVDHAPAAAPQVAGERRLGGGGFGLVLAARLAHDVGWYPEADGTKHVWARLSRPHTSAPARRTAAS